MKKVLLLTLSIPLILLSRDINQDYFNKINKIDAVSEGNTTTDKVGKNIDNYYDSVVWVDISKKQTHGVPLTFTFSNGKNLTIMLDHPVEKINQIFKQKEAELKAKIAKQNINKEISYFAGGYCSIYRGVSISKSREFLKLNCNMDFGKNQYRPVSIFVALYPDYKREEVYAIPIYAELPSGNRATFNGIVLNESKTSANLADFVDNARLRKLLGESALATNDIAYRYITGYLNAKQESRNKVELHYITTTENNVTNTIPIQTRTIAPPKVSDYLIGAGVELLAKLFSIKGKDYLYSSQPLFIINPKKVYVEGIMSFDNKGLAKRFGAISKDTEESSSRNNDVWNKNIDNIIKNYKIKKGK